MKWRRRSGDSRRRIIRCSKAVTERDSQYKDSDKINAGLTDGNGNSMGRDFASELFDNSAIDIGQEESRESALSR